MEETKVGDPVMGKYFDITFHEIDGKAIIKRNIYSEATETAVWQDACKKVTADNLYIEMNDTTLVNLLRNCVVRIDMTEVPGPTAKRSQRQDEFRDAVNTLSNIGL
ncbi:chromosome partitioning protein ParB [Loigolactobacillus backii]|uniref:chromosome partitioning protein ParB n=1 Tax=Loigolactobacillus backii TaxID=375175 RepID=UPI003B75D37A